MITFIGIDLAWAERNRTGLAVLRWEPRREGVTLTASRLVQSDDEIIEAVGEAVDGQPCLLAIDAPIIAPNEPGTMRACDRQVTRDFGRFHAGAYPANRVRCARPIRLCKRLESIGFSADPHLEPRELCRRQLEIFPHPAQVVLFRRSRIIKYKKGRVAEKRAGLGELVRNIARRLPEERPPLLDSPQLGGILTTPVDALRGGDMKGFEDRLDALLCAYMAAYYWRWGTQRCHVYGDLESGYILCPRLR